ncbi:MAG: ankyrin repeat domain-containing protein [Candidatus Anstonellales archaeon]
MTIDYKMACLRVRCLSLNSNDNVRNTRRVRTPPLRKNELHLAVLENDVQKVKQIACLNKKLINEIDEYGRTPIFYAVMNNNFEIVKYLIENGANLLVKDFYGDYIIHRAAALGLKEMFFYLVQKGLDPNLKCYDGKTALEILEKQTL